MSSLGLGALGAVLMKHHLHLKEASVLISNFSLEKNKKEVLLPNGLKTSFLFFKAIFKDFNRIINAFFNIFDTVFCFCYNFFNRTFDFSLFIASQFTSTLFKSSFSLIQFIFDTHDCTSFFMMKPL
ncbi:protein of unknown function [Streptococcus thermophilus]|nr:protein of unknown function [Streptococcus thermophilus]CAD0150404.1 protein of unknown function [Streptococcus thermophilus]